jgi:predicted RNase H-like HicB family nuclease
MKRTYSAIIRKEDQWYVAECPEVGTASQGHSIEEALENLREATELYLEEFPATDCSRSLLTTFEVGV